MLLQKRQIRTAALLAGLSAAVPCGARAAEGADAPPDPVLGALVGEALRSNPDLLALGDAVEAAAAGPDQAGALPDPQLSVLYTNDGWGFTLGERPMTNIGFVWSQSLPWPGKRALRSALAAREEEMAEQRLARAHLGLEGAVKRAYFGLLLARETLELIGDQEDTARDVEGVARSRYAVGQGAQQDVLRAQVEVTRVERLRIEQETEVALRLAEINRLLARDPATPVQTAARLELVPEQRSLDEVQTWAEPLSPELRAAEIALDQGRLGRDLASRVGQPDIVVQAGYRSRAGLDPLWQAGVGISLPVWGGKKAGVRAEAEAALRAAEHRRESIRLELRLRNQERLEQLRSTERVARLYADGIVPQAEMSVEAAIASYQSGQVPFVAVLEALSTLYDDRLSHRRLLARHAVLRAAVDELSLTRAPTQPLSVVATPHGAAGVSDMQD